MSDKEPIHVTETEARGGVAPHIVRYVLGISLALVIIAFVIVVALRWQG